jgi:hypothetical protein
VWPPDPPRQPPARPPRNGEDPTAPHFRSAVSSTRSVRSRNLNRASRVATMRACSSLGACINTGPAAVRDGCRDGARLPVSRRSPLACSRRVTQSEINTMAAIDLPEAIRKMPSWRKLHHNHLVKKVHGQPDSRGDQLFVEFSAGCRWPQSVRLLCPRFSWSRPTSW